MNIEISQQQKFREKFEELLRDAPKKVRDNWDEKIEFTNPSRQKLMPQFTHGVIDALPVEIRTRFEELRNKYYAKTL